MKLHLPVRLRKAVLACFSVVSVCTLCSGGIVAAADLTLAEADSLVVDYADSSSITDLSGGTLALAGGTELLLKNCGEGDGKTYTLLTGVSSLLDTEENPLTLTDENKAASLYFDTTQPGTGFWAGGWLQLAPDGTVQLVLHGEEVREALTITTRQTGSKTYNYYEGVCFRDITYTASSSYDAYGGAIYDSGTITLSHNGSVTFSENTATGADFAEGGAIYGGVTLTGNGDITFSGNTASSSDDDAKGGAIYGTVTMVGNGNISFSGNTVSGTSAKGGAIYGTVTMEGNGNISFSGNTASSSDDDAKGGAICGENITLNNNRRVEFIGNSGFAIYGDGNSSITLSNNGCVEFIGNSDGAIYSHSGGIYQPEICICNNDSVLFEKNVSGRYLLILRSIEASGTDCLFSAGAGKNITFRDSVDIGGGTLNLNKDYGGIEQTGDIIFTGKYTETHLNDILAADGAGRRASADEVLQSRISDVTSITVHAGRLIIEDNAVFKGHGITVHDGASVLVRDAALLHNGTYKSSSYNLTFNSGSTLGCSGSSIISGQVQMQEGSVLSFDCSDGACETTISGSLSIEGALSVTVDAGNSTLADNTVLMYVSNEVVGWDSANITLVGEDGGTLTWVDNSLVLNYNPDTYRYYYDSGYAWLNERVVGAVCMHHRVDACFDYSSLSSGGGAAIYAPFVLLNHNGNVLLRHNTVSDMPEAYGGAIYGSNADFYVDLSYNDLVYFERNFAYSSRAGNTRAMGGAIYSNINGTVRLVGNKKVEFYANAVSSNSDVYGEASGAAIYGGGINIDHNDEVLFAGNKVFGHREDLGYGGAIMSLICGVSICNNQKVLFEGNSVSALRAYGGAVVVFNMFSLNDNDIVEFARNKAAARKSEQGAFGGAIYAQGLSICNNGSVVFCQNAEVENDVYCLRSVFVDGTLLLSTAEDQGIVFRDSIHVGSSRSFNLNIDYTDAEGNIIEQAGDIIFTGESTVDDLYVVKGNVDGTAEEILASRTSEVRTIANLYNGRLIIKEGAIWSGDGIVVAPAAGTSYKPTLLLQNANLTHYEPSGTARNVVTIKSGATLEVAGKNTARYTSLILEGGSALTFNLSAANTSADTAVLSMSDSLLTLPQSGTLTLKLVAFDGITDSQAYALLTGVNQPSNWNSANITVASGTDGWDVSMADLRWDGTTLWLCPELVTATWTNESRDGKWNTTSLNWEQNEVDYEYRDGVAVVFGDEGADTVTLVGNIAPKSVLVNSTKDYIWVADDTVGGKLTGSMKLTKQGSGTLTINTSNDYTGGTEIKGGILVAGTATALGTGGVVLNGGTLEIGATGLENSISNSGTSRLQTSASAGITHVLTGTISNTGTLTLSGSFDASALDYETNASDERYALDGSVVGSDKSGFAVGVTYQVKVVDGGTSINDIATILHDSHAGSNALVLESDGYARANGDGSYSVFYLEGTDSLAVSTIAGVSSQHQEVLSKVIMESGTLGVDQSITVDADGGSIIISKESELSGTIDDTAVSTGAGNYTGTISAVLGGSSSLAVGGGNIIVSGANSYTGGTSLNNGNLTITHANALGTGSISAEGISSLSVGNGVTLVLDKVISNTGTLTLRGSIDASALQLNKTEAGRLTLSGERVGLTESGFSQGVAYSVQLVNGGKSVADGLSIHHDDFLMRTQLVLGEDGVARAGAEVDYTHYFLTGGDSAEVSKIADVSAQNKAELNRVTMDSGLLKVDQNITVSATGGSIELTKAATLGGVIENTAVSSADGDYDYVAEISARMEGDSTLNIGGGTITVSGDNSYTGGTTVNGGTLVAGNGQAFGTGDVVVNNATLDLNRFSIANKVVMKGSSTLGNADGASHIVLGSGADVNFSNGFTLSSGKTLEVATGGATYTGALTLGGGTLDLDGLLTVRGNVEFEAGKQTTIDISGWDTAGDGTVLVDFGSANSGYTDDCLTLSGIAGDWELDFDTASGVLTLVAVKVEPLPEPEFSPSLNRNQQVVYDTIKDIMGEGNPGGLLGELGKDVTGMRDEEKLKQLLDELGGAEYATLLSGQQAAARGHMRRLRGEMGSGHLLAGSKTRAYIEAYNHRSEVDGDAHGRGYELNESGGQFALEFLGEDSVSGGFAVAAGRSKLQPDGGMTQKSDNTYMDAFVMHRDGAYTAKFSLGVGVHKYDLDRRVAGNAVNADASGTSVNFMHESAWAMSLSESHSVQVFGAVESSFNKLGAFHEKGADTASLQVASQDAWVTTLSLGARYLYSFAALESAPAATLSLQGGLELDFGDTDSEVEMNFEGARARSFRQSGAERDTFGYNLGASLHLPVSAKAAIYASGDAVLRGDSYEVNANVGLQMAF